MTNTFKIYLLTRLDSVNDLLFTLGILLLCYYLIIIAYYGHDVYFYEKDDHMKKVNKYKNRLIIPVILFSICALIPSTKETILIMAGGKTMDYVQKDTSLQNIPYKTTELILKKIEEEINEVEKSNNHEQR